MKNYTKDIEIFESTILEVPDTHKPIVTNLFFQNITGLKQLDEFGRDLILPIRHRIDRTILIWKNSNKLKKHLKLSDYDNALFFKTYSDLKKFVRKNRAIVKRIEQFKYDNHVTPPPPHVEPWYLLSYIENTNIFNYYLQYLPFFKKEDKNDYVPKKFPETGIPYK